MPLDQGALLVADIGTLVTHVFLVDVVGDFYRVVARAETPSTLEPPLADCTIGVIEAVKQLEAITTRSLLHEGQLITPQKPSGAGVDALIATSSAAGTMPVVLAAIAADASGASARRALRSTYTTLLKMITLDEQATETRPGAGQWMEQQVQSLVGLQPRVVVITGGVEHGAQAPLVQLARILALTILGPRPDGTITPVIFAGNSEAQQAISDAISDIAPITLVTNVLPTLEHEDLAPLQHELLRIYEDQVLTKLPGMNRLRNLSAARPRSGTEGYYTLARFIGRFHERRVLLADVGAASTSCYYADAESASPAVLANAGIVYGAPDLLSRNGSAAIARWLPFDADEAAVTHRIFNQVLRPQLLPSSREDLLFMQALARESLRSAVQALRDERPQLDYDFVLAGGGVLTHTSHPAHAALILLDGLELGARSSVAIDLYLDTLGVLPAAGALAPYNPDAAFCLLEQDVLRGGPLATVIVPTGSGKEGEHALEVELMPVGGKPVKLSVAHGDLRRLALPRGRRATLRIKPASGVRIGRNEPGAEVLTDEAAIAGSTLGVIIDARGRPLRLPENPARRQQRVWEWLSALSGSREANPFRQSELPPEVVQEIGRRTAPAAPADQGPSLPPWMPEPVAVDPDAATGVRDFGERGTEAPPESEDLSQIRDALVGPKEKKRGFFGRKK